MRSIAWAALAVWLGAAGCDDTGSVDGTRGPCAAGGQVLGCDDEVATIEDACWKLVQCGEIPVDHVNEGGADWGNCVERLEELDGSMAAVSIACVDAASCDALAVNGPPGDPYDWPDCLEFR